MFIIISPLNRESWKHLSLWFRFYERAYYTHVTNGIKSLLCTCFTLFNYSVVLRVTWKAATKKVRARKYRLVSTKIPLISSASFSVKPATHRNTVWLQGHVCACVCMWRYYTKLLQRVNSILHVDPESEPPERDGVIGDGQGKLFRGAVDLLHTHTHTKTWVGILTPQWKILLGK